jgi:cell division protein FtsB
MGAAAAIGTPIAAFLALVGVLVTAFLSYRAEGRKASTDELDRVNQRAERYWAKVEDQQARIVELEAQVHRLMMRLGRYEEVP